MDTKDLRGKVSIFDIPQTRLLVLNGLFEGGCGGVDSPAMNHSAPPSQSRLDPKKEKSTHPLEHYTNNDAKTAASPTPSVK
jgi:hypothetical protein